MSNIMKHDQAFLNLYFNQFWNPGSGRIVTSHDVIATKLDQDENILDVGCGTNPLKHRFPNLIGIDPAFDQADIKCTIEDYVPDHLFDVALCLGSINFGTIDIIENQIAKVVSCLKPKSRIYWRLNPGRQDHDHPMCKNIIFFPWTLELLNDFALKYSYVQIGQIESHAIRPRLYAEWVR